MFNKKKSYFDRISNWANPQNKLECFPSLVSFHHFWQKTRIQRQTSFPVSHDPLPPKEQHTFRLSYRRNFADWNYFRSTPSPDDNRKRNRRYSPLPSPLLPLPGCAWFRQNRIFAEKGRSARIRIGFGANLEQQSKRRRRDYWDDTEKERNERQKKRRTFSNLLLSDTIQLCFYK